MGILNSVFAWPAIVVIALTVLVIYYKLKKKKIELEIKKIKPLYPMSDVELRNHLGIDKAIAYIRQPDVIEKVEPEKVHIINDLIAKHSLGYVTQNRKAYKEIESALEQYFPEAHYVYIKEIK